MQVDKHWNTLPREAVESPSVDILKTQPDKPQAICSCWPCLSKGWSRCTPEVSTGLHRDSTKRLLLYQ